ncbi:MAG: sodium-dependent transporter [Woeseiaceae bacterium]|nr:sodium-dependent transporter [Woeseiaceae bacterium]
MAIVAKKSAAWSSRSGFLLATIGGAVGLGNLWRFPYVAGEYGGGGFVIIYLAFVFFLGIPLIAGEMLLGRRGHRSAVNSMAALVREHDASPVWKTIGWLSVLIPFIGFSYYAVIAAWAIDYFALAVTNAFAGFDGASSGDTFSARTDRPVYQAGLHALWLAATVFVVAHGVNKGIERASRVLMPALFVALLSLVGYGVVAGDIGRAAEFLFAFKWDELTTESILVALGQAMFSLGIGVGLMIAFAAYVPQEFSLRRSATVICIADTIVALLAGFAIFPIVFAASLDPASGPGLIFVTLPVVFGNMAGGHIFGIVFFALLIFAAFTSTIAMLECVVTYLEEKWPGARKKLSVFAAVAVWVLGLGSVLSFSTWSDMHPLAVFGIERTFFSLADFTVANVLVPINAFLIAVFAGWVLRNAVVDEEFSDASPAWKTYWRFANRFLAPVALLLVFIDLMMGSGH